MKTTLKFNRAKPTEVQFARILEVAPDRITPELAESASQVVQEKLREKRFTAPQLNGFDAFEQVAQSYPAACRIVFTSWTQGTVDADAVESEYVAEEA